MELLEHLIKAELKALAADLKEKRLMTFKFHSTPNLLEALKQNIASGQKDPELVDKILKELMFRNMNDEAAALIASIEQQRRQLAEDVAQMTDDLNKRERNKRAL